MPRWYLLVVALLLAACGSGSPDPAPTGSPTPTPSAPTTEAPTDGAGEPGADAPIVASWELGAPAVELPDGSVVVHCEGDAPLLCIERDGVPIGLLSLSDFELTEDLKAAVDAGAVEDGLRDWADEHLEWVETDRGQGCGDGYVFEPEEAVPARVAGLLGVRLGFSGTEGGVLTERVRTYATVVGERLWLVTAEGASPEGCMASDELLVFEPAVLVDLLPVLDRVVAGTPLPGAAEGVEDGAVVAVDGGLDGGLVYVVVDGRKQRVQQPRAMTYQDVAAEGLEPGDTLTAVALASAPTGSYFLVVPPDGVDARLHLAVGGIIHPVHVRTVDARAIQAIPDVDASFLDRLEPAA